MNTTTPLNPISAQDAEFYAIVEKLLKAQEMYDRTKHYVYHHEIVGLKKLLWQHISNKKQEIVYNSQKKLFD